MLMLVLWSVKRVGVTCQVTVRNDVFSCTVTDPKYSCCNEVQNSIGEGSSLTVFSKDENQVFKKVVSIAFGNVGNTSNGKR